MSSRKKIAAVVITTVALSVGTVGVASASQGKSSARTVSVKQSTTRTTVNAMANPMAGGGIGKMDDRGSELTTVLSGLVTKGTITQAQSDAITAALTAARTAHVALETKEIDAAVTAGKITAAQATTFKADLTTRITAQVDAVGPAMGAGMGLGGGMGGRGRH